MLVGKKKQNQTENMDLLSPETTIPNFSEIQFLT